ncbi:MAG: PepSY-like domain-containing protein [Prevotella sp.]|nr:PepSY-like domain-containing protein [Prevotella sp.]
MVLQSATCFADDRIIPVEQLPAAAKTFVQKHFPKAAISYASKDFEFGGTRFEARLADGTEVDFDNRGNWDKVDCYMQAVPAALIPATIAQYIKANHPGTFVTKIDKERYGYEIELSNDLDLKFNRNGQLIGFDD